MGFLDEIKKLAKRRTDEHGLITDTLNKTRNLRKVTNRAAKKLVNGQDDENRKRHGEFTNCIFIPRLMFKHLKIITF